MELEALKKAIYDLNDHRVKLKTIEEELKMPKNSLSGMLNGTRPFPQKWIEKLEAYVKINQIPSSLSKETVADLIDKGIAITQSTAEGKIERVEPFSREALVAIQNSEATNQHTEIYDMTPESLKAKFPEAKLAASSHKSPPPGLTKPQKIRWHRENTQTLQ